MSIRRALVLSVTALLLSGSVPALAQQAPAVNQREQQRRNQNQQADASALAQLVDMVHAADPAGSEADQTQGEVTLRWVSNHFMRTADGSTYVPFTVQIERAGLTRPDNAAIYLRAVARGAAAPAAPAAAPAGNNNNRNAAAAPRTPTYAWERISFTEVAQDGKFQRPLQLAGGEYDVYIAVRDQSTGDRRQQFKTGLLRHRLTVPDYSKPELQTSSLMVGPLGQATAAEAAENPYVIGNMKLAPMDKPSFGKAAEFVMLYFIYGFQKDMATGKPNLSIEYAFYQKTGDTEKYFNKTAPRDINATTVPPDFDLSAGQLPEEFGVPLASFPAGDYRLEVKVTDKVNNKVLTQNVAFTVTP